jgi:hypothetical protein
MGKCVSFVYTEEVVSIHISFDCMKTFWEKQNPNSRALVARALTLTTQEVEMWSVEVEAQSSRKFARPHLSQ